MDMLEIAKDLITKGNALGDPDLITMGYNMLQQYGPVVVEEPVLESVDTTIKHYECSTCGQVLDYDKDGRKKCPQCKKLTLILVEPVKQEILTPHRPRPEDFSTQIRQKKNSRVRYNEDGKPDGVYAKVEQVEGITNVWDDDRAEGFDEQNEKLKQFTKISPRNRKPVKLSKVVCDTCKNSYEVHPIHAGGRGRYICDRCVSRRSKV